MVAFADYRTILALYSLAVSVASTWALVLLNEATSRWAPNGDPFTYQMNLLRYLGQIQSGDVIPPLTDSWYWFLYFGTLALAPLQDYAPELLFLINIGTLFVMLYVVSLLMYRLTKSKIAAAVGPTVWVLFPGNLPATDHGSLQVVALDASHLMLLLATLSSWLLLLNRHESRAKVWQQAVVGTLTVLAIYTRGRADVFVFLTIITVVVAVLATSGGGLSRRLKQLARNSWIAASIAILGWVAFQLAVADDLRIYYAPHQEALGSRDWSLFASGAVDILSNIPGLFITRSPGSATTTVISIVVTLLMVGLLAYSLIRVTMTRWTASHVQTTILSATLLYAVFMIGFIWSLAGMADGDVRDSYFSFSVGIIIIFKQIVVPLIFVLILVTSIAITRALRLFSRRFGSSNKSQVRTLKTLIFFAVAGTPLALIISYGAIEGHARAEGDGTGIPFASRLEAAEVDGVTQYLTAVLGDEAPCVLWRRNYSSTILNYYRLRSGEGEWWDRFNEDLFYQGNVQPGDAEIVREALARVFSECPIVILPNHTSSFGTNPYRLYQQAGELESAIAKLPECEFRVIGKLLDNSDELLVLERSSRIEGGDETGAPCYDESVRDANDQQSGPLAAGLISVPRVVQPIVSASSAYSSYGPEGLIDAVQPGWHAERATDPHPVLLVDFGQPRDFAQLSLMAQDGASDRAPKEIQIDMLSSDGKTLKTRVATLDCSTYRDGEFQDITDLPSQEDVSGIRLTILQNCGNSGLVTLRGIHIK